MTFMMQQQVQRKSEKYKNNLNKINNSKLDKTLDIGQYDNLWRKLELGFAKSYKSGRIFGKWKLR